MDHFKNSILSNKMINKILTLNKIIRRNQNPHIYRIFLKQHRLKIKNNYILKHKILYKIEQMNTIHKTFRI